MDYSVVGKYFNGLFGKFRKSDLKSIAVCSNFFVITFKTEWTIISSEGDYVMSISPCGQIIGVDKYCFFVKKDNVIAGYNGKGEEIGALRSNPQ